MALLVCMIGLGLAARDQSERQRAALLVVTAGAVILVLSAQSAQMQWAVFLPPVVINAFLCVGFGRTLRPGHEPMIAVFGRRERGGVLEPDLAAYARKLTYVWTALFACMGFAGAMLALFAPLEIWSLFTNFVSYILAGVLFIADYAFRRTFYSHYRHGMPIALLRHIRWPENPQHAKEQ